jgi:hypothetical protein
VNVTFSQARSVPNATLDADHFQLRVVGDLARQWLNVIGQAAVEPPFRAKFVLYHGRDFRHPCGFDKACLLLRRAKSSAPGLT